MAIPSFLRQDGDSLIFNRDGYLIFFVPELFFSKQIAVISGADVSLLGMFSYAIYDNNDKCTSGLKQFDYLGLFLCSPSEIETKKDLKLTKESKIQDYRLLKFKKGDTVIVSTKVPKSIQTVEDLFSVGLYGNIPNTIPYDQLHEIYPKSMKISGNSFGVNMQMFGLYVAGSCRSKKDKNIPFRLSGETNMKDYYMAGIREVPNYINAFTCMVSENWNEGIIYGSMNNNKKDVPLEKIMMM